MEPYSFVTTWRVDAPANKVWDALQCMSSWWPGMESSQNLNPGQEGIGARYERITRGRLPYSLRYIITITRFDPPRASSYDSEGDLVGKGSYVLTQTGATTEIVFTWDVATRGFWMNVLAPALKPLFAWNHNYVMAKGEKALARYLHEGARGRHDAG